MTNANHSFTQKAIDVTLNLGTGDYGESGFNTVKVSGRRVYASINMKGGPSMSSAEIRIFGLSESVMNALSSIGDYNYTLRRNTVVVEVGDKGTPLSQVYKGGIRWAYQMYNQQPDVFFQIISVQLGLNIPTSAFSAEGDVSVVDLLKTLAKKGGITLINDGVEGTVNSPALNGSISEQINQVIQMAHLGFHYDGELALHVYPANTPSPSNDIPLINPASGLIGYPDYVSNGVKFRTLFNPSIKYNGQIKLESDLKQANGEWTVSALLHDLTAEVPGGAWFSEVEVTKVPGGVTGGAR